MRLAWDPDAIPATPAERAAAVLIDAIVFRALLVAVLVPGLIFERHGVMGIGLVVVIVGAVVNGLVGTAVWGRTLGQWMKGIRVVDAETGRAPGWRRVIARSTTHAVGGATPFWPLMYAGMFTRKDRRGLHDRIAGTIVVRTR